MVVTQDSVSAPATALMKIATNQAARQRPDPRARECFVHRPVNVPGSGGLPSVSVTLPVVKKAIARAAIETGFIVFLFYSNLLMGEFAHSGKAQEKGLSWAIADVFTPANFLIAVIAAAIGYVVVEFLRKKF